MISGTVFQKRSWSTHRWEFLSWFKVECYIKLLTLVIYVQVFSSHLSIGRCKLVSHSSHFCSDIFLLFYLTSAWLNLLPARGLHNLCSSSPWDVFITPAIHSTSVWFYLILCVPNKKQEKDKLKETLQQQYGFSGHLSSAKQPVQNGAVEVTPRSPYRLWPSHKCLLRNMTIHGDLSSSYLLCAAPQNGQPFVHACPGPGDRVPAPHTYSQRHCFQPCFPSGNQNEADRCCLAGKANRFHATCCEERRRKLWEHF